MRRRFDNKPSASMRTLGVIFVFVLITTAFMVFFTNVLEPSPSTAADLSQQVHRAQEATTTMTTEESVQEGGRGESSAGDISNNHQPPVKQRIRPPGQEMWPSCSEARKHIVQISPVRSGSTLIYNILRICFPSAKVVKRHYWIQDTHSGQPPRLPQNPENPLDALPPVYVSTYRHPYNIIISKALTTPKSKFLDKFDAKTTENFKAWFVKELKGFSWNKRIAWLLNSTDMDAKENLHLLYEGFVDNHQLAMDKIEEFFECNIDSTLRKKALTEMNLERVYNQTFAEKGDDGNFKASVNKTTQIHEKHVSKYKGHTNYKDLLDEESITLLEMDNDVQSVFKLLNRVACSDDDWRDVEGVTC